MIQPRGRNDPDDGSPAPAPQRFRDRHRLARHREFLDAARQIMTTEGPAALTMQRVTDTVGSSTGGIYVYFPSKDALIAELQREALQTLRRSYLLGQASLDAVLEARHVAPADAALTRVIASGRFWVAADETMPNEIALVRGLLAPNGTSGVTDSDESQRVFAAAMDLVEEAQRHTDQAVELSAITPGNNTERALVVVSSIIGVMLTSTLARWENARFDGYRLATQLVSDLAAGWGATPEQLARAADLLADVAEDQLAPPVDHDPGA